MDGAEEQKGFCFLLSNLHSEVGAKSRTEASSSQFQATNHSRHLCPVSCSRHPSDGGCFCTQLSGFKAPLYLEAQANTWQLLNIFYDPAASLQSRCVITRFLWSESPKICHTMTLSMLCLRDGCMSCLVIPSIICPCSTHMDKLSARRWCLLNCRAGSG